MSRHYAFKHQKIFAGLWLNQRMRLRHLPV